MPVSFKGDYPNRSRVQTGCASFDIAVAGNIGRKEYGLPTRCGYHIFSAKSGIGKTTVALSLAAMLSGGLRGDVKILAIDTFDRLRAEDIMVSCNADGEVEFLFEGDPVERVEELYAGLQEKKAVVSVLDSVNLAMSKASYEGKAGDSNMGKDAFFMSNHLKKMFTLVTTAKSDKVFIITNMAFPNLGFVGNHTKGGVSPNATTSIHLNLSQGKVGNKNITFPQGKLVACRVDKNNFGVDKLTGNLFVAGETGIHVGMTAVYDLMQFGYATESRGKVSLGGEAQASIKDMVNNLKDASIFAPFIDAIGLVRDEIAIAMTTGAKVKKAKVEDDDDDEEDMEVEKVIDYESEDV